MKNILLIIISLFMGVSMDAQTVIHGVTEDSVTHEPLPQVNIQLVRNGRTVKFTRSDNAGKFSISVADVQKTDSLQTSYMGYRKQRFAIIKGKEMVVRMTEEAFSLKEVTIKGGRISGKQDTITYDLTRFANERDNSLKDILAKLPGVDVAKNGQINYNGKAINRFTVEGLDLTGGRYNQLTENIKAKDVKKAEVIEHDQPIKALQNKVFTDNVAMNIGLKDDARDKLMLTLKPYLSVGETISAGGSANIMQIGKKRQMMYDVAYDRTGRDLSASDMMLAFYGGRLSAASLPAWLTAPSLSSPIDDERLRFNTSQKYNVSRIQKSPSGSEIRVTAGYNRSVIRQETSNTSLYYLTDKEPVKTEENKHLLLKSDDLDMETEHKINKEKVYGNDIFKINASQADGLSSLNDSLSQRVRVPKIDVSNSLYRMFTKDNATISLRSVMDYHHSVSDLYVNDSRERLRTNLWHTASSLSWMLKSNAFTQRYAASIDAENMNVGENHFVMDFTLSPYWQYKSGGMTASLSADASLKRYADDDKTFFLFNPNIFINWKPGSHHEWYLYSNYKESTGGMTDFALKEYRTDYRSVYYSSGIIPLNKYLSAGLDYSYKRPVMEFFYNASASFTRSWRNTATDMQIKDGQYRYSLTESNSQSDYFTFKNDVAKGFFDLHLKLKLGASFTYNRGEQLSSGDMLNYDSRIFSLQPVIEFSPKWCNVSYQGTFTFNNSHTSGSSLGTLFNWRQSLSVTSTIGHVDITLSGAHYRNDIYSSPLMNTLLADASAVWRMKKLRLRLDLHNMFNKKEYIVTNYSGISTITNTYNLRPRELMLSAQLSL